MKTDIVLPPSRCPVKKLIEDTLLTKDLLVQQGNPVTIMMSCVSKNAHPAGGEAAATHPDPFNELVRDRTIVTQRHMPLFVIEKVMKKDFMKGFSFECPIVQLVHSETHEALNPDVLNLTLDEYYRKEEGRRTPDSITIHYKYIPFNIKGEPRAASPSDLVSNNDDENNDRAAEEQEDRFNLFHEGLRRFDPTTGTQQVFFIVEKILRRKKLSSGQFVYQVKWAGWKEVDNDESWKEESELEMCMDLLRSFKKDLRKKSLRKKRPSL